MGWSNRWQLVAVWSLASTLACAKTGAPERSPAAPKKGAHERARPADASARPADAKRICAKQYQVCYELVEGDSKQSYSSEAELVCTYHCTDYGACWDELNPERVFRQGGWCTESCSSALADPASRARQVKILRCQRAAKGCQAVLDCGF